VEKPDPFFAFDFRPEPEPQTIIITETKPPVAIDNKVD